jgi:4a-hydroxytetrahydrobiopterin dehydratase
MQHVARRGRWPAASMRGTWRILNAACFCSQTHDAEDIAMTQAEKVYSDEEIQQRLTGALQHWYLEDGWLRRKFKTESWKGTLMVVNTVGHLAEAAWHHPDLTVSYAFVVVKLKTHSAKGITDKDFALASKIEDVIHWQPGKEGGALEGTPADDQRFRYIKYDAPKA